MLKWPLVIISLHSKQGNLVIFCWPSCFMSLLLEQAWREILDTIYQLTWGQDIKEFALFEKEAGFPRAKQSLPLHKKETNTVIKRK
ncbi:unnamed protein product [Tenebrio molitor]|nr:unnamed protein product [Tenebrio molitor]